jgi:predicted metal-dependent enzyme (double-stranded beta helix superfamily)
LDTINRIEHNHPAGPIMSLDSSSELSSFYAFVGGELQHPSELRTPEECLEIWRTLHPQSEEVAASAMATKAALVDMAAGDTGRAAHDIVAAARKKFKVES